MPSLLKIIRDDLKANIPDGLNVPENFPNLICTDSRNIKPGQWFLPIVGEAFDGHKFVTQSLEQADGFIYQSDRKNLLTNSQIAKGIEVSDTLKFFQELACVWRNILGTKVVGITGSTGKTTAKEMTAHILSQESSTYYTQGSFNNEVGVPKSLCELKPEHRFAVIEMGARHVGDIEFLCKYVNPDVAVLLNVGTAHIGEFGSAENLRKTKQEIFTSTRSDCVAIYHEEDHITADLAAKPHPTTLSFGTTSGQVRVVEQGIKDRKMNLAVQSEAGKFQIQTPGYHLAYPINFAAAVAVAQSLGLGTEPISRGIETFLGIDRRFKVYYSSSNVVIDDTYNANPQSMKTGLESITRGFPDYEKVLVLGDMLELGSSSAAEHNDIGKFCADFVKPNLLVTVGPEGRIIGEGAISAGMDPRKISHFIDIDTAVRNLSQITSQGNLLYAKASNSIKLNKIIQAALQDIETVAP